MIGYGKNDLAETHDIDLEFHLKQLIKDIKHEIGMAIINTQNCNQLLLYTLVSQQFVSSFNLLIFLHYIVSLKMIFHESTVMQCVLITRQEKIWICMLKADDRGASFLDFIQSKFKSNISHVVSVRHQKLPFGQFQNKIGLKIQQLSHFVKLCIFGWHVDS